MKSPQSLLDPAGPARGASAQGLGEDEGAAFGLFELRLAPRGLHFLAALLARCRIALLIRHPSIHLPAAVAKDLAESDSRPYVRYRVQVNRTLRASVEVERFAPSGFLSRLFVLGYWLGLLACVPATRSTSMRFGARVRRFAGRRILGLLRRARVAFFGDAEQVSPRLNQHILTAHLGELDEFRFPAGLHVALTKNCNLKCIMCPYHAEDLRAQHVTGYFEAGERMPADVLERIISEAGRFRANLAFGQYDEPFIYKGFASWAAKAKQAGCTVSVTTNGTLLPAEDAAMLLEAGVEHISFSLDAASAESYRKIRLDDFAVPIANLRRLVEMRNAGGYRTQIRACMVLQEQNRHEHDAFLALMRDIGVDMVSYYNLSVLDNGVWVTPALNFVVEEDAPGQRSVCSQLYKQMAIYPDGRVALCCLTTMYVGYRDDVPYVGNVKESSLRDIWLSSAYSKVRHEAFENRFSNSVCRDCTIWHNYQGRESVGKHGYREYKNAYETFIYLR